MIANQSRPLRANLAHAWVVLPLLSICAANLGAAGRPVRPLVKDCTKNLAALYRHNPKLRGAIGFHGTSVEALERFRAAGVLLSGDSTTQDDIYFFPNLENPTIARLVRQGKIVPAEEVIGRSSSSDPLEKGAYEGAMAYAMTVAQAHKFLSELKIEITSENRSLANRYVQGDLGNESAEKELLARGYNLSQLQRARAVALRARGVVLLIGPQALKHHSLEHAELRGDDGMRLVAPKGIPPKMFIGLEPMGQAEYDYLENLAK